MKTEFPSRRRTEESDGGGGHQKVALQAQPASGGFVGGCDSWRSWNGSACFAVVRGRDVSSDGVGSDIESIYLIKLAMSAETKMIALTKLLFHSSPTAALLLSD